MWIVYIMVGHTPVMVTLMPERDAALAAVREIVPVDAYIHADGGAICAMFDGSKPDYGAVFDIIATNEVLGITWAKKQATMIAEMRKW